MQITDFEFEERLYKKGCCAVAGADEAGRGAWAGPIAGAAVILPRDFASFGITLRDSKLLTEKERERLFEIIIKISRAYKIVILDNTAIDKYGINAANVRVLASSITSLSPIPDFALIDGLKAKFDLSIPFSQIPHGDQRIASIAAASILAKVTRDRIMKQLDLMHQNYGFAKHKGYGTALHKNCLSRFGVSNIHRKSYAPIRDLPLCRNQIQSNQSKTSLIRTK